ncbi:MAG: hypothetical protein HYR87_05155, partial [Thaumarchaeota archaeon]|nr:hypothetical protein [Nitrososphaerota archaeon]
MYNNTLRKITSLSLLTILLTSTAAFAMPNALPQAHASTNANLFVSAEMSQYSNYFAGPQVIQVVVSDPDIQRLDQAYGEPTVTVNGKKLRMTQNTDGNWYAYFADSKEAQIADSTSGAAGKGLDFGTFCSAASAVTATGVDFSETKGVALAYGNGTAGGVNGTQSPSATISTACHTVHVDFAATSIRGDHVVRENKTLTHKVAPVTYGQIGYTVSNAWPIVQLYDFSGFPTTAVVDYQKAGGDQIVTLTFDRIPVNLVSSSVDRTAYPANSQVFVTIKDPQLNIDPTEEDSWTWGANSTNSTLFYQAYDRNGKSDAESTTNGMQTLIGNLTNFMFNHNGKFTLNPAAQGINVVQFGSNGKQNLTSTAGVINAKSQNTNTVRSPSDTIGPNSAPVTFIESGGVNTGVFANWDGAHVSDLTTTSSLTIRGQSATIRYNDVSTSIVGNFGYGTLSVSATNGTWASGQKIPITLVDSDANLNSKLSEHRDLFRPTNYQSGTGGIPVMTIGTPFSIANGATNDKATFIRNSTWFSKASGVSGQFTARANGAPTIGLSNVTTTTANADAVNVEHIALVGNGGYFDAATGVALANSTFKISRTGGVIIDSSKTVTQLLNSVHDDLANDTEKFKGFNFINYDLRSIGTNATGSVGNVGVYLITNPLGTGILTSTGHLVNNGDNFRLTSIANSTNLQDFINLNGTTLLGDKHQSQFTPGKVANGTQITLNLFHNLGKSASVGLFFNFTGPVTVDTQVKPIAADFFSVGIKGDGTTNDQRINNAIYRFELEETGDNTSTYTGTTEFVMLNQLNIFDVNTYSTLRTINHQVQFVAIQDMLQAESRAPQASYEDLGYDGQFTILSAQQDIPTHTGVVSFDSKTYKIADTVTITLNDADLNVNNDLVDIYTTIASPFTSVGAKSIAAAGVDPTADTVGKTGLGFYSDGKTAFGRLLDVQFGQQNARWSNTGCFGAALTTAQGFNLGLADTGFSLVETGPSTGIFTGNFEVPDQICDNSGATTTSVSTTISSVGLNLKVNYVDFRDESGKKVEVSDNAGVRGNTGSITLDKSVYPVPFGAIATSTSVLNDFATPATSVTSKKGIFPLHRDNTGNGLTSANTLNNGDTLVHIRVNDADYNTNPAGTDHIAVGIARGTDTGHGPVWAVISRQSSNSLLAFAGGSATLNGVIKTAPASPTAPSAADAASSIDLGPMTEIDPSSGIFQADLPIRFTDGPAQNDCPVPDNYKASNGTFIASQLARFDVKAASGTTYCVRQGDVLTVYYNDTNDASGHQQIVTDSATFDLRNGVLQSDKSVYIIGSDMILTLVEPDLNLDSQQAEAAPLDLVEWDSHAFKGTMGPLGLNQANFDAKPSTFVETGKDTGIFQSV